jgi:hypothetical protein
MQVIEVDISPKGEVSITTKGFSGSACRTVSQALERALGVRQTEQLTSEFYRQQVATDQFIREGQ